ncbi:CHAT domain-containing protein [Actinocrispum wychmicini]|uniref:CHAT domain-containing protein n=1 Tax=Actinocrispum wychmicini TaxID=1213861 RepID=A0A4R2JPY1_9PSEU|nr:CHAT domain-containing protein [Actinocrispum wychmicini]TCO59236.1 CHAT domain-containing protein [Actinocrispum wychmicini]
MSTVEPEPVEKLAVLISGERWQDGVEDELHNDVTDRLAASVVVKALTDTLPRAFVAAGWYYWRRFESSRGTDIDLQAAAAMFAPLFAHSPEYVPFPLQKAFQDDPGRTEDTPQCAADRATALLMVAARASSAELTNACIHILETVVTEFISLETPPDELPDVLLDLAMACEQRYRHEGDAADLDRMIDMALVAVERTPPGASQLPVRMSGAATALSVRYRHSRELSDADGAVALAGRAVELLDPTAPYQAKLHANLAAALIQRYEGFGAAADLRSAVAAAETAVQTGANYAGQSARLTQWCYALRRLAELNDDRNSLEVALDAAVEATGLDKESPEPQIALGSILTSKYAFDKNAETAEVAVDAARRGVELTSPQDPERSRRLSVLCLALRSLSEATRATGPLDEAIRAGRVAVELLPDDHRDLVPRRIALGVVLQARYDLAGGVADLVEAGVQFRRALESCTSEAPDRAACLDNLGLNLRIQALRTGDPAELDQAIAMAREAVQATPPGHQDSPSRLNNLGVALIEQAELSGGSEYADEAARVLRDAARTDRPERLEYLANLASVLLLITARNAGPAGDMPLLDEAQEVAEAAVVGGSAAAHSVLGAVLLARFERSNAAADLSAALNSARAAVTAARTTGVPELGHYLSNLAGLLVLQLDLDLVEGSADELVAVAREAVDVEQNQIADQARRLVHLAIALRRIDDLRGAQDSRAETIRHCRTAAHQLSAPVPVRIRAAAEWAHAAVSAGDWATAHTALRLAVGLLDRLAPRNLKRDDQQRLLADLPGLAVDAAACAVRDADARTALDLLEQGRCVLLGQALDTRVDLSDLAAHSPRDAAEFIRLCTLLESTDGDPQAAARRKSSAMELTDLIERIRRSGLNDFLRPFTVDPATDGADGPIAVFNVSRYGSDALVLTSDGVTRVPLPDATPASVRGQTRLFLAAVEQGTDEVAEDDLSTVLSWLWEAVVGPVVTHLGFGARTDDEAPFPRLWLCPTGLLSFLPLHAAGHAATPGGTLLDYVVPSYTASVRALRHARRKRPLESAGTPRALVVEMQETDDDVILPGVRVDAALLGELLPEQVTRLSEQAATASAILESLTHHHWVHFACHATTDLIDPSRSSMAVVGSLDIAALGRARLDTAELAYLSACSTAQTTPPLADEAIHMASAFQLMGYRHVIAALWPVYDRHAATIATQVYSDIVPAWPQAKDSPVALHAAVRALRRIWSKYPSVWASYIHIGC